MLYVSRVSASSVTRSKLFGLWCYMWCSQWCNSFHVVQPVMIYVSCDVASGVARFMWCSQCCCTFYLGQQVVLHESFGAASGVIRFMWCSCMSRLISFVLADAKCDACEECEDYKEKTKLLANRGTRTYYLPLTRRVL